MNKLPVFAALLACLCLPAFGLNSWGQDDLSYRARLAVMPIDRSSFAGLSGGGAAEAELSGARLTITGRFAGLSSAAASAFLHRAEPGLRGPAIMPLEFTQDTEGSLGLSAGLTAEQAEDFRKGFYYLQVNTTANPGGEIRGWLLPGGRIHE